LFETLRHAGAVLGLTLAGRNLNEVLSGLYARLPTLTLQQRAAIQDLSFGALRFYGRYAALLDLLVQKPLADKSVRCLLLVSLHQLENRKTSPPTVVDQAVKAAKDGRKPWATGLVNAVLRNFLRNREALLEQAENSGDVARYSHPQWWIDLLRQQYPLDCTAILEANNRHPPMMLRINRRKTTPSAYADLLRGQGLEVELLGESALLLHRPVAVGKLPGFADGLVSVQDAGAQRAAPLLDVAEGMRVLDACAAPGGKSVHLLELADLALTALDIDPMRLEKIADNLKRLGLAAHCVCGDAALPAAWWDGRQFDRILADVPCSASGVVRRHPDIKWLRQLRDIPAFSAQQRRILDSLWCLLARDGKLLYVTCSVFAEENQQQIDAFLSRNVDARQLPVTGTGQLLPDDHHDGFYYALLAKIRLMKINFLLGVMLWFGVVSFVYAEGIEIKSSDLELVEETYQLNAEADITFNPTLEDALNKGVPLHFLADFELKKPRWYWLDETISAAQQHIRLSYHALTRQYQLSINNNQLKSFSALNEARRELGRINAWPVLKRNLLKEKQNYVAGLRFRLDLSQLPKPLQVNALADKEWDLDSDWFRWSFAAKPATPRDDKESFFDTAKTPRKA